MSSQRSTMATSTRNIVNVPTSIVSGFFGVENNSIHNLLNQKPKNERWAVLINEFGEVGVMPVCWKPVQEMKRNFSKEVPGGCMCCTNGLPMQMALNQLLSGLPPPLTN